MHLVNIDRGAPRITSRSDGCPRRAAGNGAGAGCAGRLPATGTATDYVTMLGGPRTMGSAAGHRCPWRTSSHDGEQTADPGIEPPYDAGAEALHGRGSATKAIAIEPTPVR